MESIPSICRFDASDEVSTDDDNTNTVDLNAKPCSIS